MSKYKQGSSKTAKQPAKEDFITIQFHESVKASEQQIDKQANSSFYPIDAKAMNSSTSNGKSRRKFVLNRAVTVSANKQNYKAVKAASS